MQWGGSEAQHGAVAAPLVAQARAQRDGQAETLADSPALPELIKAPGVLIYDIESDPDARDDFLHGFVCLPRDPDGRWAVERASYHPLLMLQEHGEGRCWQRIKRFLNRYEGWPVLHFGETEWSFQDRSLENKTEAQVTEQIYHWLIKFARKPGAENASSNAHLTENDVCILSPYNKHKDRLRMTIAGIPERQLASFDKKAVMAMDKNGGTTATTNP